MNALQTTYFSLLIMISCSIFSSDRPHLAHQERDAVITILENTLEKKHETASINKRALAGTILVATLSIITATTSKLYLNGPQETSDQWTYAAALTYAGILAGGGLRYLWKNR